MAGTFTVQVENDWLLLETGVDNLIAEDGTSNLATESAPAWLDLTSYLEYNAVALKFNTIDLTLLDTPAFALHLREDLTTTNPAWTGSVTAIETSDPTELLGHELVRVTGTNARTLPTDTAPFDLSESPGDGTFQLLQEDGVSRYLLETGTDFADTQTKTPSDAPGIIRTEGALSYGYRHLVVRTQVDSSGVPATHGTARVYQPGLRSGNIFKLTSTNQGYNAQQFQVNQENLTWPDPGASGRTSAPWYEIEFGDTPATLALWATQIAPSPIVPVTPPVVLPTDPVIYGKCSSGHNLTAISGGVITIASATFSISAPSGHSNTVQLVGQIYARAYSWSDYVATPRRAVRATISGGIFTGAWQETPFGVTGTLGPYVVYSLSSAPGISLPDGTYTVSIQVDNAAFNQVEVQSAWAQAAVTTT